MNKITVLLADDHPIVRSGLRALIVPASVLEVIGEAADGRKAVRETLRLLPDVVLMDVAMPLLNGLEATRQILRGAPHISVLILSTYSDDRRVEAALGAGAKGYLIKSTAGSTVLDAIRDVHRGRPSFSPAILQHLSNEWEHWDQNGRPRRRVVPALSCRQAEVLQLVAEGFGSKEIAALLGITVKTVEKHRQSLMAKLDIHEISTLTRYAVATGIIELNATPLRPASLPSDPLLTPVL